MRVVESSSNGCSYNKMDSLTGGVDPLVDGHFHMRYMFPIQDSVCKLRIVSAEIGQDDTRFQIRAQTR